MEEELCRLCALKADNFIGIYEDEGHKLSIEMKINKCLQQIKVCEKDPLPKSVCLACCSKLEQFSDFVEVSALAQTTLQRLFLNTVTSCNLQASNLRTLCEQNHYSSDEDKAEYDLDEDEDDEAEDDEGADEEEEGDDGRNVGIEHDLTEHVVGQEASSLLQGPGFTNHLLSLPSAPDSSKPDDVPSPSEQRSRQRSDTALEEGEIDEGGATDPWTDAEPHGTKTDCLTGYPWMCTDCSEQMDDVTALRTHHLVEHKQAARYTCVQCSKVFSQYSGFCSHVKRHRNLIKYCCHECGRTFSNKKVLDGHTATHSDTRPHACPECGKRFKQQSALYIHARCHLPDDVKNKFGCDQCDKRFSTKPNLVTHKRIHTGVRNFTCEQCGKSFIQKGNLDAHMLTHSLDKPFSCDTCHKCFKTGMQLRKHHTVHTGAKPHQCDVCGRTFRERGTLREHHRIHTGAMPFACEFCGKAFRFKGILTTHRRQHTGERPYSCLECQHHFTNWPNYNKHMKRRHNINTSRTTRAKVTQPSAVLQPLPPSAPLPPLYEDSIGPPEDLSLYNPPHLHLAPPSTAAYMAPATMISFYNLTAAQMHGLDNGTTAGGGGIDLLQHR